MLLLTSLTLLFINSYQPSAIQFITSGGTLVNSTTNDIQANVAAINTGITLPSPRGSITPALNDVILFFDFGAGNFESIIGAVYHTD